MFTFKTSLMLGISASVVYGYSSSNRRRLPGLGAKQRIADEKKRRAAEQAKVQRLRAKQLEEHAKWQRLQAQFMGREFKHTQGCTSGSDSPVVELFKTKILTRDEDYEFGLSAGIPRRPHLKSHYKITWENGVAKRVVRKTGHTSEIFKALKEPRRSYQGPYGQRYSLILLQTEEIPPSGDSDSSEPPVHADCTPVPVHVPVSPSAAADVPPSAADVPVLVPSDPQPVAESCTAVEASQPKSTSHMRALRLIAESTTIRDGTEGKRSYFETTLRADAPEPLEQWGEQVMHGQYRQEVKYDRADHMARGRTNASCHMYGPDGTYLLSPQVYDDNEIIVTIADKERHVGYQYTITWAGSVPVHVVRKTNQLLCTNQHVDLLRKFFEGETPTCDSMYEEFTVEKLSEAEKRKKGVRMDTQCYQLTIQKTVKGSAFDK